MPRSAKAPAKTKSASASDEIPSAQAEEHADFVEAQRQLLLSERDTYMRRAELLRDAAETMAREMEPGDVQFDEESGEGDTMNVERERDLTLSAQARGVVDEIDEALARVAAGTYGYCVQCHQPIPRARLEALPHAALCVACKSGGLSRR